MAFISDSERAIGHAELNLSAKKDLSDVSYLEAFQGALTTTIQTELWASEWFMKSDERELETKIDALVTSGEITSSEANFYRKATSKTGLGGSSKPDYKGLSTLAKERGLVDQTIGELRNAKAKEIHSNLKRFQEMQSKDEYGLGAATASFFGSLTAGAIDPPNIASMLIPVGQGLSLLKQMAVGASVNMATEAALMPQVSSWKDEIGLEHTFQDSVTNVAFAGILGAGMPAFVAGVKQSARMANSKLNKMMAADYKQADLPADDFTPFKFAEAETAQKADALKVTDEEVEVAVPQKQADAAPVEGEPVAEMISQTDMKKLSGKAKKKAEKKRRKEAKEATFKRMEEAKAEEVEIAGISTKAQEEAEILAARSTRKAKAESISTARTRLEIERPERRVTIDGVEVSLGARKVTEPKPKLTKAGKKRAKHAAKIKDEKAAAGETVDTAELGQFSPARAFRESAGKPKEELRAAMPKPAKATRQALQRAKETEIKARESFERAEQYEKELKVTKRAGVEAAEKARVKIEERKATAKAEADGIAKSRERRNRKNRIAKLTGRTADVAEALEQVEIMTTQIVREVEQAPVAKGQKMNAAQIINKVDETTAQIQRETLKDSVPKFELKKYTDAQFSKAIGDMDVNIAALRDEINASKHKVDSDFAIEIEAGQSQKYTDFKKQNDEYQEKLSKYEKCRKGGEA